MTYRFPTVLKPRPRAGGFTLVELLVVIGIIALLISILLPALSTARKQAILIKCMSNERSIGQAMIQYSSANKGVVVPSVVWKSGVCDNWALLLVINKYLPDPKIPHSAAAWNSSEYSSNSVTVCPAVRSQLIYQNYSVYGSYPATDPIGGFERDSSQVLAPSTTGNKYDTVMVEIGYGINGLQNPNSINTALGSNYIGHAGQPWYDVVSNSISFDPALKPVYALKKVVQFRYPTRTVMLYDGLLWNQMNYGGAPFSGLLRVTGARHGKFNPTKLYDSGLCNMLFMDGHVESVERRRLPTMNGPYPGGAATADMQFVGSRTQMRDPYIIWSVNQQ